MLDQRAVGQARPAAESPSEKAHSSKRRSLQRHESPDLNIGLAFDADLSKGRTQGTGKSFSSSHRWLIRQEANRVFGYET